jgi:group II intron reverse transcriptase/maturase
MSSLDLIKAFQQVKKNAGCAGVDGISIEEFEAELEKNCVDLAREVGSKSYLPLPLLKILIDKGGGETRALCIPAVRDRVLQTAVLEIVTPILDRKFEECSFGYRKGRSVLQAIETIRNYYDKGYHWVLDCDIDAFFDSVDHEILLRKVAASVSDENILRLIRLWIKGEIWDGETITIMDKGIPQGSPISPILANLFLDELDESLMARGQKIVRYADDFVVLCRTPEKAGAALSLTKEVLDRLVLRLDEAEIVNFDHGFRFLGVLFLKSMALRPLARKKELRGILHFPASLNMEAYFREKKKTRAV